MGQFIRGTGDSRTVVEHEEKLTSEYLRLGKMKPFKGGPNSGKPIVMRDDFSETDGDTRVFHFVPQNRAPGLKGQDVTITGNEQSIDEFTTILKIDQMAQAFKTKGKMTKFRTMVKLRDEFFSQLKNWWAMSDDVWMIDALTGLLTNGFDYVPTAEVNTTVFQKGAARMLLARSGSSEIVDFDDYSKTTNALLSAAGPGGLDMDSTDKMNSYVLDNLGVMLSDSGGAKYNIKPVTMANGEERYLLLLDTISRRDLRQDTRFESHMISMLESGHGDDPIASGAMGMWDNIIIKKVDGLNRYEDPNTAGKYFSRNLLLGQNALGVGYGQHINYVEEGTDYDRINGVAADEIRGQTKLNFDGVDMGVAQVVCATNF